MMVSPEKQVTLTLPREEMRLLLVAQLLGIAMAMGEVKMAVQYTAIVRECMRTLPESNHMHMSQVATRMIDELFPENARG